jgi:uncharacterized protein YecE (DUF72 family)
MAAKNVLAKVYLGTSGYAYYHWRGIFYPADLPSRAWLSYYANYFNAVELNVTFYREPREKTFKEWASSVPYGFAFVLKAPRLITHLKRLQDVTENAFRFLERACLLGDRLSCILWQFPPSFNPDIAVLKEFFLYLKDINPGLRHAVELRNRHAFNETLYKVLSQLNVALVCAHSNRYPCQLIQTADFSYFKFHGPGSLYNSRYSKEELDDWISKISNALKNGDVYVFFNNDYSGYAVDNASYLKEKLGEYL